MQARLEREPRFARSDRVKDLGRSVSLAARRLSQSPSLALAVVLILALGFGTSFNADPAVVGQTVRLNQPVFSVLGVVPGDFVGLLVEVRPDLWVPISRVDEIAPSYTVLQPLIRRGFVEPVSAAAFDPDRRDALLGLTSWLSSLLVEVRATNPATFVAIPVLLILVALLACLVPALRAARVTPMLALRRE